MSKQLINTIKTKNKSMAIKLYRRFNSEKYPNYSATIAKKEGGDNTILYIVSVYLLTK